MASETAPSDDDRLPAASAPPLIAVGAARPLPESARRLRSARTKLGTKLRRAVEAGLADLGLTLPEPRGAFGDALAAALAKKK